MKTRRNVLTLLGLAGAGSAAVASDDLVRTDFDGGPHAYRIAKYDPERMAVALERLATEIRDPTRVHIARFHIGSEAVNRDWLTQTLTIDIEIMHPDAGA